jgi:hypothetical protein
LSKSFSIQGRQNLLRDKSISNERPDWRFAIQSWFREIKDYPNVDNSATYRYIHYFPLRELIVFKIRFIPGTGHFAQTTWAGTTIVGTSLIQIEKLKQKLQGENIA